ncbi:hypothetical protein [Mesorhizobium sp. L-8-3]|uniref:hypothetical protein n=1 Tax=Mesorhizobium sp. L-8-3 TaxID=2744522 RepID=UPI0019287463|nr:hypothetical protein [Mesorhizobium sp. L-8-3]BCH24281.1 hypothetical protein MesoLjLb_40660 [Mesorhizobium sp. L-8-3]
MTAYLSIHPFKGWLAVVEPLDAFQDAPTIRIQLAHVNDTTADNEKLIEALKTAESWPWEEDNKFLRDLLEIHTREELAAFRRGG